MCVINFENGKFSSRSAVCVCYIDGRPDFGVVEIIFVRGNFRGARFSHSDLRFAGAI